MFLEKERVTPQCRCRTGWVWADQAGEKAAGVLQPCPACHLDVVLGLLLTELVAPSSLAALPWVACVMTAPPRVPAAVAARVSPSRLFAEPRAGPSCGLPEPYFLQGHKGPHRDGRTEPSSFLETSLFLSVTAFQIQRWWSPTGGGGGMELGTVRSNLPKSVSRTVCLGTLVSCE